jgi:hypothetical protein
MGDAAAVAAGAGAGFLAIRSITRPLSGVKNTAAETPATSTTASPPNNAALDVPFLAAGFAAGLGAAATGGGGGGRSGLGTGF